jgi:hypothetical protein
VGAVLSWLPLVADALRFPENVVGVLSIPAILFSIPPGMLFYALGIPMRMPESFPIWDSAHGPPFLCTPGIILFYGPLIAFGLYMDHRKINK